MNPMPEPSTPADCTGDPRRRDKPMTAAYIDRRCTDTMCERKTHYVVKGRCTNCAWEGYVWITLGHDKVDRCAQAECPRCGCRMIRPGEYVDA